MLLNSEQLIELTGFKRPHKQVQALEYMGIQYRLRLDGKPVVDDSVLRQPVRGAEYSIKWGNNETAQTRQKLPSKAQRRR